MSEDASASARSPAASTADRLPAVELIGIDKRFGPVHANRSVDLRVPAGTIHGIVGENGAGKSTLMNILYGFYQADRGIIQVDGQERQIHSPEDAIAAGIGMVHQHFMLVEPFTVLENLLLGAEGGATLAAGSARARSEIAALEREYGLDVALLPDPGAGPPGHRPRRVAPDCADGRPGGGAPAGRRQGGGAQFPGLGRRKGSPLARYRAGRSGPFIHGSGNASEEPRPPEACAPLPCRHR
jgi:ABC-type Fe3+/spermidine/putrescine transport system ATPase subunit